MNLQQVKPDRHGLTTALFCCECCKMKNIFEVFADLEARPFTYVCHECATTYKGVDDEAV